MNNNEVMKNQIIHIRTEEADALAQEYFINICGLNKEGEKYKKLLKLGMDIKDRIRDMVDIRAIVSSYDRNVIIGNRALINGTSFICNAFTQINKNSIINIHPYIITSGSFNLNDDEPIMNQLYAEIWGTAYVDAGLEILKDKLNKENTITDSELNQNKKSVVLDSFGPGFYGMDVTQVHNFFKILDGEKIGVHVRSNGVMIPIKSCTGFFVVVNDETQLPASDCKSCCADNGCEFCQAVIKGKR